MISVVSPATYSEPTGRSADLQSAVSQNCILHSVERGPGRRASPCSGPCRLQIGDTADCKSALRHRICVTAHLAPQIENRTSVLTTNTSGSVQVRTLLYVGHWAGLLSGLSGHQFARESIRLARNCRRRSAQGTEAQAAARELRVEAEQSRVALRCDLHLAGGAGRIAGRDREEPASGGQAQDMPHARGSPKAAPARISSFDAGATEPPRREERSPTQHRRRRQEELSAESVNCSVRKEHGTVRSNSSPFSDPPSGDWTWPASAPIASLRFNGAPPNCTGPGSGCWDKGADRKSCNKLIEFCFDSYLPCANLYSGRFARRRRTRRARALEVNVSGVMKSSADSGGGIDESWIALYLSRTRQGNSTTSRQHRHWLTQQSQHEMKARSPL